MRDRSPRRQETLYVLSSIKLHLGERDQAIRLLEEAIELDPEIEQGWWRLAYVYGTIGNKAKAREVIEESRKRGIEFSQEDERGIQAILR